MRKLKWIIIISLGASAYIWFRSDRTNVTQYIEKLAYLLSNVQNPLTSIDSSRKNTTTEIFKFQDENGQWHFGNEPFDEQTPMESTTYRSDTNIISPTKAPVNISNPGNTTNSIPTSTNPIPNSPLSVYTNPASVKKLIDDAQQLQGKLNERSDAIDNIINTH